jgi:hypothetical protein
MTKRDDLKDSEPAEQSPQVARQSNLKKPFFINFKFFQELFPAIRYIFFCSRLVPKDETRTEKGCRFYQG